MSVFPLVLLKSRKVWSKERGLELCGGWDGMCERDWERMRMDAGNQLLLVKPKEDLALDTRKSSFEQQ